MRFSCFPVLPGCAEAHVSSGGRVKRLLVAYFISNIFVKKYQDPFMCVTVIAGQRWDVLRHVVVYFRFITFRVSRRPREMYCGHARLCVCLSVCLSVCVSVCVSVRGRMPTLLHGPGCNLGEC